MSTTKQDYFSVFSDYLKKNGLKMTRQRRLILETFLGVEGHLSADELYEVVCKKDPRIGFTTIFRTLKAMTECGLARETDLNDGRTRFERLYRTPRHHHIVCQECSKTIEFYSPELEEMQAKIASEYGLQPVQQRLQILGVCKECQEKTNPTIQFFDNDQIFARDALKIAMATEKRGIAFYRAGAESSSNLPSTQEAFLAMLAEEERHLEGLLEEWDRLIEGNPGIVDAPVFLHFDFERLQEIFPPASKISEGLLGDMTEIQALRLAMEMELEAYEFFTEYAERFADTQGRDVFAKFAAEEHEHYTMIKSELDRVSKKRIANRPTDRHSP